MMRTLSEIRAGNPVSESNPVPFFTNTDDSALEKNLSDPKDLQETLDEFEDIFFGKAKEIWLF